MPGSALFFAAVAVSVAAYALARALAWPAAGEHRLERLTGAPRPGGPGSFGSFAWLVRIRERFPRGLLDTLAPPQTMAATLVKPGLDSIDVQLLGLLAALGGGLLVSLVYLLTGHTPPALVFLACGAVGIAGPRFWLRAVARRHQAAVLRELPKAAELLTLGTESGLGLLEAIRLAVGLCQGPVALALRVALAEVDAGRETIAALKSAADRMGGQAATSFVASVAQGLELGSPVARVLRVQADTLRARRRQELESRIAGVSLRLTLVTVLFFVPALFVLAVLPNLLAFVGAGW